MTTTALLAAAALGVVAACQRVELQVHRRLLDIARPCRRCGEQHPRGVRCRYATCTTCTRRHPIDHCPAKRPLPGRWFA